MKLVRQRTVNKGYGDCFGACLASILELPIEVIPNDHSESWYAIQKLFLNQFGIDMTFHNRQGPIWSESPWIASVKSKNYNDGTTHAIIMKGSLVFHDPSTKTRYKKGTSVPHDDMIGGYIMRIEDFSLLHKLDEYRNKLCLTPRPT